MYSIFSVFRLKRNNCRGGANSCSPPTWPFVQEQLFSHSPFKMLLVTILAVISLSPLAVLGGDEFYSLEAVDIQGNKVSLSDFKDKVSRNV